MLGEVDKDMSLRGLNCPPIIKELLLFSSQFIMEVLDPDLLSWLKASTLPKTSLDMSKLHRDVCDVFLLGTGAGGGPSKELSESITVQESCESLDPHTSNTLLTCTLLSEIDSMGTLLQWRYLNSSSFFIFLRFSRSDALSVWRMMAWMASMLFSGTSSLLVTVWAKDWRSSTLILHSNSDMPCFSCSDSILCCYGLQGFYNSMFICSCRSESSK